MCQSTVAKVTNLDSKADLRQQIRDEIDMWRILFKMYEENGIVRNISNK